MIVIMLISMLILVMAYHCSDYGLSLYKYAHYAYHDAHCGYDAYYYAYDVYNDA